jgi:two-component system CheB/CheR fusion protein
LYLVILEEALDQADVAQPAAHAELASDQSPDALALIAELRDELRAKDDYLQSTHEELETANEELKSWLEETQSVNEEMQSVNEELETSKEELQSVNEELATVNSELSIKVDDLSRVNNDMNNLLAGTGIATVFVDHQLRLLRFTPMAAQLINLIASDVGRPVGHFVSNLVDYTCLAADVQSVLDTLVAKDLEVRTTEGAWYALRIRPYRTLTNVIEGAVITFSDISELKRSQAELTQFAQLARLAVVLRDAGDAITVQDLAGHTLAWNPAAERLYGWTEAQALALNVRQRIPKALQEDELVRVQQLSQAQILAPYLTQRLTLDGRLIDVSITATDLINEAGEVYGIATNERAAAPRELQLS